MNYFYFFLYKLVVFSLTKHINCSNKPLSDTNIVDLVSIAFNNPEVIAQQIRLIKKYIADPYFYTIADNSNDQNAQLRILKLCKEQKIAYINLPHNPYSKRDGSQSQGTAMNWVLREYILPRQASFFGFIDHDIFPIRSTQVINILNQQNIFGNIQVRNSKWYLWAGFCFFKREFITNKKIDFTPGNGLDTGGNNWKSLYHDIDPNSIINPTHDYGKLREGDCPQSDWYEIIGDWIHTFNASGWMKVKNKTELINKLLNQY